MSLSEKLDAVVTTDTLQQIGQATVKAFGDAKELAQAGVEASVSYVWWQGVTGLVASCVGIVLLTILYATLWIMSQKSDDEDTNIGVPVFSSMIYVAITFFLITFGVCDNVPVVANPQGYMIYKAVTK